MTCCALQHCTVRSFRLCSKSSLQFLGWKAWKAHDSPRLMQQTSDAQLCVCFHFEFGNFLCWRPVPHWALVGSLAKQLSHSKRTHLTRWIPFLPSCGRKHWAVLRLLSSHCYSKFVHLWLSCEFFSAWKCLRWEMLFVVGAILKRMFYSLFTTF